MLRFPIRGNDDPTAFLPPGESRDAAARLLEAAKTSRHVYGSKPAETAAGLLNRPRRHRPFSSPAAVFVGISFVTMDHVSTEFV